MLTFNDPYRVTAARISREKFRQIARARFAPAVLAERDPGDYYDAIIGQKDEQGRFVDPLFILIMFEHESTYGKAGAATQTKSWGNTRPPSYGVTQIGQLEQYIGGKLNGYLSMYATWLDGCTSTAARLLSAQGPYAGRLAILEIFEHPSGRVWAPAGDHNNPASYINAIITGMNRDGDQVEAPTARRIQKPVVNTSLRTPNWQNYAYPDGRPMPKVIEAICNHISDGSQIGDLSWLTNPESEAGANYYINRKGEIFELAPPTYATFTNGPRKNPDLTNPLIKMWNDKGINPNTRTVSIEHEGHPVDRLTQEQIKSNNHLTAWLSDEYNIPLDRTHIIGHYQIDNVDRSYCPSFDEDEWAELISGALAYFVAPETLPSVKVFDVPGVGKVQVAQGFLRFYETFGGLERDGWPMTPEIVEDGMTVQYFERSRYEWHPGAWPERWDVLRGRLGVEIINLKVRVRELEEELDHLRNG